MRIAGFLRTFILTFVLSPAFCRAQQSPPFTAPTISLASTDVDKDASSHLALSMSTNDLFWLGPDQGLRRKAMAFEASFGAGLGIRDGSLMKHDLAIAELRAGRVVSELMGKGHFYQGNFMVLGEAFTGAQFHPQPPRYFAGFAPVLRYEFATGTRFSPFVDLSTGLVGTDIGHPDLGANFEFDLQGGPGVKYYICNNAAVLFQYRYLHFSNAGLFPSNHGINVNTLFLGFAWGFQNLSHQ